jgi:hypothetical protein
MRPPIGLLAWPRSRPADLGASAFAKAVGITPLPARAGDLPTGPMAAANAPKFARVSTAEVLRLELRLGGESTVDSGPERLILDAAPSVPKAAAGVGGTSWVTKQPRKIPAIDEESEPWSAAPFSRGGAFGVIGDPPGANPDMLSRAWPNVEANESPAVGVPPKEVEAGSVGVTAPAGWT